MNLTKYMIWIHIIEIKFSMNLKVKYIKILNEIYYLILNNYLLELFV